MTPTFRRLEVMALTPWGMSLSRPSAAGISNCLRPLKTIARQFEFFADGEETKEQANKEVGEHLLAFGRQFSADTKPALVSRCLCEYGSSFA